MNREEKWTAICFLAFFVFLLAFFIIVQPVVAHITVLNEPASVGTPLICSVQSDGQHALKMALDHVDYSHQDMTLHFVIVNDTNRAVAFTADYVNCFCKDVLLHGDPEWGERQIGILAHQSVEWTVKINGIASDVTICYLDIPNEIIFASWKSINTIYNHKSDE